MKKYLLLISMFFLPTIVFASSGDNSLSLIEAILIEAFMTFHVSFFVFNPFAKIFSKENYKKVFWISFIIRLVILLYFDFFQKAARGYNLN